MRLKGNQLGRKRQEGERIQIKYKMVKNKHITYLQNAPGSGFNNTSLSYFPTQNRHQGQAHSIILIQQRIHFKKHVKASMKI